MAEHYHITLKIENWNGKEKNDSTEKHLERSQHKSRPKIKCLKNVVWPVIL